jgi:hypothetical protein
MRMASGIKIDYVSQSKSAICVHVVYKHVRWGEEENSELDFNVFIYLLFKLERYEGVLELDGLHKSTERVYSYDTLLGISQNQCSGSVGSVCF